MNSPADPSKVTHSGSESAGASRPAAWKVAHVGENLLTRLRDGKLLLNPEITTGLLNRADGVRQMLKEIESTGHDGDDAYPELLQTLTGLRTIAAPTTQPAASS